jgi:hypothetical protein
MTKYKIEFIIGKDGSQELINNYSQGTRPSSGE